MKAETSLTSVKILKEIREKFDEQSFKDQTNLQIVINRSLFLYNTDEEFRKKIKTTSDLISKGKF